MLRDAQENDDNKAHLHETLTTMTTARVPTCAQSVKLTGDAWSQPGAF